MATVKNIPPNGTIKLYGGIDIGNGRQPIFSSRANQIAYYNKHLVKQIDGMSYMRMGDRIKIEATVDEMAGVNFMSFTNRMGGEEREIYCYIDPNWEYVNNNTIAISYSVASFQTLMFDVTFKPGQIEREHLSEPEWINAVERPYINMHQLATNEPLPSGRDLEKICKRSDFGSRMKMIPDQGNNSEHDGECYLVLLLANANFDDINGWTEIITEVQQYGYGGQVIYMGKVPSICSAIAMRYTDPDNLISDPKGQLWHKIFTVIEANSLTGNIMGLYYVPKYYVDCMFGGEWFEFTSEGIPVDAPSVTHFGYKPDGYTPRNPKLFRYPYSFLRITANDGSEVEYKYEDFVEQSLAASPSDFYVATICSLNGNPLVGVFPYHYKYEIDNDTPYDRADGPSWIYGLNMYAGIVYTDIPHIPYATDGYVAYLASQARSVAGSTTFADAIMSSITSVLGGVGGVLDTVSSISDYKGSVSKGLSGTQSGISQIQQAYQSRGNTLLGYNTANNIVKDPVANVMDESAPFNLGYSDALKSTLTADNVFSGSPTGFLQYLKNPIRFMGVQVILRDDVVEIYDKWFDYYGYASSRIGVPHVVSYFKGGDDQPHFAKVDGDTVTYAKARVFCIANAKAPKMMCDDIEQMFANGTLFVKKD